MHILVIDDSEDGRDIAEAMLLSAGYEHVSTAGSAAMACIVSSGSQACSGHTAAGLPPNSLSVKAST